MKNRKKAALHNLGCKVNAYETEAMQQLLEEAGYEIVPFSEYADVVIVGAGCYVQTKEAQALVDETINIVIGNNKKSELVKLLEEYNQTHEKNVLAYLKDSSLIDEDTLIIAEASLETSFDYLEDMGYNLIKYKKYKTNAHIFIRKQNKN